MAKSQENTKKKSITARIISMKEGLHEMEGVQMIRIISKKYNLLIMEDYLPIIGEIDGSVVIVNTEEEKKLEHVQGFFCHSHNVFSLMLKEEGERVDDRKVN